ncbi:MULTISPECIES: Holliday junction branch migration protein RuvA [unclassified Oleiphilus]|nr:MULTISPECIES: Holliday junction branch migration protein RuvA [unclassified Oleiphilus]KZY46835.1 Holliday junction DNA helicase RuvA [Oleiphilus sp. HI0050]KZY80961.1 Holliday junction DNA helicase RuvA [Oleiphilus sp. HI0069]KZY88667.1 Holliday junction DNA helicase RuvA [Oleiphilus sp. HI0072]KZZ27013.1 Holliday junction DNA helicase RuvA [Oleiphilus sp. HI0081]KZZ32238.1 Holliday junction DNA helicase RuvA [Oleiphilus sp. HI0085]
MIGKLLGIVEEKGAQSVLLNVSGICYEVEVPISTSFSLPEAGASVSLYTHFVVREDAQLLYGFLNKKDRDMFRVLIKVNGVGPKLGITILSGLDSASLARCVADDDVSTLVKLPGIGKKTAERLLIELRDKVKGLVPEGGDVSISELDMPLARVSDIEGEAEAALISLGYKPQDAAKSIKSVRHEGQTLESLLKAALKGML